MIGLPLLTLLPILALFGLFDKDIRYNSVSAASIRSQIEYPANLKFKDYGQVRIKVTNTGSLMLDTVSVSIDTTYLSRFLNVSITPNPSDAYEIDLTNVRPGEKREVIVEYEGKEYGEQSGTVTLATSTDTIRQRVSTRIFW